MILDYNIYNNININRYIDIAYHCLWKPTKLFIILYNYYIF